MPMSILWAIVAILPVSMNIIWKKPWVSTDRVVGVKDIKAKKDRMVSKMFTEISEIILLVKSAPYLHIQITILLNLKFNYQNHCHSVQKLSINRNSKTPIHYQLPSMWTSPKWQGPISKSRDHWVKRKA